MRTSTTAAAVLFLTSGLHGAEPLKLTPDLRIRTSVLIVEGTYALPDRENDGAVVIEGDDITVDFRHAALRGAPIGFHPDQFTGKGVVVRGRNVVIRNARVHGYLVGIYAEDAPGLTLDRCDVSRNFRQHLNSTTAREDLSDWLYGHDNENNEWIRYGAGIYLLNCPNATVSNCRARNGQNGLCLVKSDGAHVVDNDFSFLSGWGLAMWRSSRCDVFNNRFDWCIRGYSHEVYSRGQDSTGILVYEQCHDNVFAFNSATHGGDGFFLYAGNETLQKTGSGGCNNNLVYRNDFSHAAANGIEATFSRGNRFIENVLDECEHGVWAGYSVETWIADNLIRRCRNGVSIEHGRNNRITANIIEDSQRGIHLWWDEDTDLLASPFCRKNDSCPSTAGVIEENRFNRVKTGIHLADDVMSRILRNRFKEVETPVWLQGRVEGTQLLLAERDRSRVRSEADGSVTFGDEPKAAPKADRLTAEDLDRIEAKKGSQYAMLPIDAPRGRKYIYVDDWGPYDFSDIRLFPSRVVGGATGAFQVLGPPGTPFRVELANGSISVDPMQGSMPAKVIVRALTDGFAESSIRLSAGGNDLTATAALLRARWRVSFFVWDAASDPRSSDDSWSRITTTAPRTAISTDTIDFAWGHGAPVEGVPPDRFAVVASTQLELPAGKWRFSTISDDGIRVLIDEKPVIENWTWHGPTRDDAVVQLPAETHEIRIEYFEIDGYAQLQFAVDRANR